MEFKNGANDREVSRRTFLKRGADTAGALAVGVSVISGTAEAAPNEIGERVDIEIGDVPNETYVLADDVSTEGGCINISEPFGITIDGAGHTISGDGTGVGINAQNRGSVTIRNLELVGFDTGIRISGGTTLGPMNATLENVSIHDNETGALVESEGNLTLHRSTVRDNRRRNRRRRDLFWTRVMLY